MTPSCPYSFNVPFHMATRPKSRIRNQRPINKGKVPRQSKTLLKIKRRRNPNHTKSLHRPLCLPISLVLVTNTFTSSIWCSGSLWNVTYFQCCSKNSDKFKNQQALSPRLSPLRKLSPLTKQKRRKCRLSLKTKRTRMKSSLQSTQKGLTLKLGKIVYPSLRCSTCVTSTTSSSKRNSKRRKAGSKRLLKFRNL